MEGALRDANAERQKNVVLEDRLRFLEEYKQKRLMIGTNQRDERKRQFEAASAASTQEKAAEKAIVPERRDEYRGEVNLVKSEKQEELHVDQKHAPQGGEAWLESPAACSAPSYPAPRTGAFIWTADQPYDKNGAPNEYDGHRPKRCSTARPV